MRDFFSGLLQRGKTVTGAVITLASTLIGLAAQLSPDDLGSLATIAHGGTTVGQVVIAIGVLDKLRKAAQGKNAM